jgi:hypothetical protein
MTGGKVPMPVTVIWHIALAIFDPGICIAGSQVFVTVNDDWLFGGTLLNLQHDEEGLPVPDALASAFRSGSDIVPVGTFEPTVAMVMQFSSLSNAFGVTGFSVTTKENGVSAARFKFATQPNGVAGILEPQIFGTIDVTGHATLGVSTS